MTYTHSDAVSLANNEALRHLLDGLDREAREALVTAAAEDTQRIRDHQSVARVVASIRERVKLLALTTEPKPPAGLA